MTFLVIVTQRTDDIWHQNEIRSKENETLNLHIRQNDVDSEALYFLCVNLHALVGSNSKKYSR